MRMQGIHDEFWRGLLGLVISQELGRRSQGEPMRATMVQAVVVIAVVVV
jgi:hypothetical protein